MLRQGLKIFILLASSGLLQESISSQTRIIDSLNNALKASTNDSTSTYILTQLANQTFSYDTLKAYAYLEKSKILSDKLKWDYASGDYYMNKAILKQFGSEEAYSLELYDSAKAYFEKAALANRSEQEVKNAKLSIATCNSQIAGLIVKHGNTEEALKYYTVALAAWEASDDKRKIEAIGTLCGSFSTLYYDLKQYDKALEYDMLALSYRLRDNNEEALAWALIYVCDDLLMLKRMDSAKVYLEKARPIVNKLNHHRLNIQFFSKLGQISRFEKDYPMAVVHYLKLQTEAQIVNNRIQILVAHKLLGATYSDMKEYRVAKRHLDTAMLLAEQGNFVAERLDVMDLIYKWYEKTGDLAGGYPYLRKHTILKDSLSLERSKKMIAEMDSKYKVAQKEKDILLLQSQKTEQQAALRQKSTFNYILLGGLTSLLVIGLLIFRNLRNRQKLSHQTAQLQTQRIRELEQEKQLVAFNSLLKGQEEERSRMAKDLHDGLGGMLSGVKLSLGAMKGNIILTEDNTRLFARALDQLDNSISEMRRVAHNMMPEALVKLGIQQALQDYCDNLNDAHQVKINCQFYGLEKRLDAATEIVVYRIVQELLNNVVKHSGASNALVQVMRHENNLNITVEDNGKGYDPECVDYAKGAGLINVRSRVDYLKGQMDIQTGPAKGTSVHIDCTLPEVEDSKT